ncbi:hypothetical protein SUDANB145_03961 [Streptomyces sp. enrichment culture]
MSVHASDSRAAVPPMPERSPEALRAAIAQYAPHLRVHGSLVGRVRDRP